MKKIKEKKERSLGAKLFLKAERCVGPKCVMVRRPYRPGQHGQKKQRASISEYARQLQEKQKVQVYFNLNNRQMRTLFKDFDKEKAINTLGHRFDQVLFTLGLSSSPRVARQLISHGHMLVNGKKNNIPSYSVKVGDVISINPKSQNLKIFENINAKLKDFEPPSWFSLEKSKLEGKCLAKFSTTNEKFPFDEDLVGEFYAR